MKIAYQHLLRFLVDKPSIEDLSTDPSLYTLMKDKMKTLKYVLGSLDDLLEFYSSFPQMNLKPTTKGLTKVPCISL